MSTMNGTSGFQGFEFSWKRPKVPPRLWSIFEGRKRLEDGRTANFIIQEMPEEMTEEVLDHVINYCFAEETVSAHVGLPRDPLGMREMRSFLKCWLLQGVTIVALLANPDPTTNPRLVGVNVMSVLTARDDVALTNCVEKFRSKTSRELTTVGLDLAKEVDVFEMFGVDRYLGCFGFGVLPPFRGLGLGEEMLRVNESIGRAYEVPISATLFTGPASQVLAQRTGFELLIERKYTELFNRQGNIAYPGISAECTKYMAKKLY